MAEMFGSNGRLLGTRRGRADRTGRLRKMRRNFLLERLEDRQLLTADIVLSFSNNEILLSADSTVTSLDVLYNSVNQTFGFLANTGETFENDGSLPNTVVFSDSANTASLSPTVGDTWTGLGYTIGIDTTTTTGTAITLGGAGSPTSGFPVPFTISDSGGGTTDLTIDDSDDASAQTVSITNSSLGIGTSPAITYSGSSLTSLNLDGSATVATIVDDSGTPSNAPLTVSMGSSTSNAVNVGDNTNAASTLGDVTIEGTTGLTIDDESGSAGQTIDMASTHIDLGTTGPIYNIADANFASLTLETSNVGGNTVNVASSPAGLASLAAMTLAMGTGGTNTVNLGDATDPVSDLAGVTVSSTGSANDLTIDDSAGAITETVTVTGSSLTFSDGPVVTYTSADSPR